VLQDPCPNETKPTCVHFPPLNIISGPPESPKHTPLAVLTAPQHSCFEVSTVKSQFLVINTVVSKRGFDTLPLSVTPQPATVNATFSKLISSVAKHIGLICELYVTGESSKSMQISLEKFDLS
jgi:hypothetical protein